MKFAKRITMVLCDDIREEQRNKFSLIGTYTDTIIINKTPAVLPKLCMFIMLIETKKIIPKMEVVLKTPNVKPFHMSFPEQPNQVIGQSLLAAAGISPCRIEASGDAKFEIRFEGEKRPIATYNFKIRLAEKTK